MAPKRRAATAATGPVSASQPTPQRPNTRGARKRRHSDASDVSEAVSITSSRAASTTSTKATKRKRQTFKEGDAQVIVEEEEVDSERETTAPACGQGNEPEENDDEIEVSQPSKKVRLTVTMPVDKQDSTTPHHKMTVKRRKSSDKNHSVKRVRMSRTSLPASLAPDGAEPEQIVSDFTFSPLSTVLQKRMQERKSTMHDDIEEEEDEDQLVLDEHDETVYPDLGAVSLAPVTNGTTHTASKAVVLANRVSRDMGEEERENLRNAVIALEKETNVVKAKYKVQHIAIQALGFGLDGLEDEETDEAKAEHVLKSIRQAFDEARSFLEAELPGSVPDDVVNEEVLSICRANVSEFASRLRKADREAREWLALRENLVGQINHLLDQLSDSKLESTDLKRDKERLTATLNEYITEEARLKELITRMEQEHRDTFAKMNTERETTVRHLEDERDRATELSNERLVQVENLQGQVRAAEAERDNLNEQLQEAQAELDAETDAKEAAQEDLATKALDIEELEGRITSLDNDIADLNQDIDSLRALKDSGHDQRVAAETELDEKNSSIDTLEAKIRDAGKVSNELRAKIFELQNLNSKLEQSATAREQEYESDLAAEVNRREAAVELAEAREAEITRLETDLENAEQRLRDLKAEKDARISALEDSVAQKDTQMQDMEDEYRTELESREETITELGNTLDEFQDAYQNSQEEASDYKAQVENRDSTIANLQEQITSLEQEKSSLEDRVEKEAMHALELQNSLNSEINALNAELEDRQQKLDIVYEKREQEEKARKEYEEARDAELAGMVAKHERKVEVMQENNDDLKRQLAAFLRQAHESLVHRQEARRERVAEDDAEDEALKAGFMKQLDDLNATATPTTVLSVQQKQKVVTKPQRKRKRQTDSGIGLDGEVMEEEMVGA